MKPADCASRLVLDTNVVLDWLVFGHACGQALTRALASGSWVWIATAAMHDELEHVLSRGTLDAWRPDLDAIRAARSRWAVHVEPKNGPSGQRFRCTDPDDQKFIDLALQLGQSTLLSRDRAVLKLARRAREAGVLILAPEAWQRALDAP